MPSVMGHRWDSTPTLNIERSKFDRSHGIKTAFDADYLIPVLVDEILPGDSVNCRMSGFARLSTPLKPVMDNMFLETFFFFVPARLLWTKWEKFCGAQDNPGDSIAYTIPTIPMGAGGPEINTLSDYFGIPTDQTDDFSVNALPFRAHNKIWNDWFRAQEQNNSLVVDTDDGPDTLSDYVLRRRNKKHDYFTSCLLAPQRGTAVSMALGTSAPITRVSSAANGWKAYLAGTNTLATDGTAVSITSTGQITAGSVLTLDPRSGLIADLSAATSATINQLRESFLVQGLLERDARYGTRYVEVLKGQFGVTSPDFRLQRSEYLGGGSSLVNVHPVPMTAMSSGGTAAGQQGNLAGFGTASFNGHGFNKSFTEHGYIIGFVNVRADLSYSQGLDRMWSRSTRYDFYWPALAHMGEQPVYLKEIYNDVATGTGAGQRESVFGYQERYGDYRMKRSQITSIFRPAYATPLDTWHLSQKFTAYPSLDATFMQSDTPVDRVIAVPSEPHFIFDGYFDYKCARPMPVYGIPAGLGRF